MTETNQRLHGRRCLITAAGSGLGLEIAEAFDKAGARIAICDLSDDALEALRISRPHWQVYKADVSDEAQVEWMFGQADAVFGGLDVLVNNAGIAGPTAAVEDITAAQWRLTMEVNLTGMFFCTRAAVKRLRAAGGGALVNLASSAGRFGFPLRSPYSASKWGVIGFTKSMAIELGPHGITANAILPGLVSGSRLDAVIAARAAQAHRSFEEQKALMLARVPLRGCVEASDVASTAVFLASTEARYITGETLGVDAGLLSLV